MGESLAEEIAIPIVCAILLIIYYVYLAYLVAHRPETTVIGLTRTSRRDFVKTLVVKKDGILGVQTLRNQIMGSTVIATSSVALIVSMVAVLSSATRSSSASSITTNPATATAGEALTSTGVVLSAKLTGGSSLADVLSNVPAYKVVVLIALYLCSLFWLTQAIRLYNHFSILICTTSFAQTAEGKLNEPLLATQGDLTREPSEEALLARKHLLREITTDIDFNASILNRASLYQTIGLRLFYIAFPTTFWVFGVYYFLAGTVLLILAQSYLDLAITSYKRTNHHKLAAKRIRLGTNMPKDPSIIHVNGGDSPDKESVAEMGMMLDMMRAERPPMRSIADITD